MVVEETGMVAPQTPLEVEAQTEETTSKKSSTNCSPPSKKTHSKEAAVGQGSQAQEGLSQTLLYATQTQVATQKTCTDSVAARGAQKVQNYRVPAHSVVRTR